MVVYVAFARTSGLAAIEWYKCPELPGRQEELTRGGRIRLFNDSKYIQILIDT